MRAFIGLIGQVYHQFMDNDGLPLSGNIAFCTLLALFPFLMFITTLAGFLGNEELAESLVEYLMEVAPEQFINAFSDDIRAILTVKNKSLLTLSVGITLYVAAGGVESIRVGLARAYQQPETRNFLLRVLQNMTFVVAGAFVLLMLAMLLVVGPVLWGWITAIIPTLDQFSPWFHFIRYPLGLGLLLIGLFAVHLILPGRAYPISQLAPGVFVTMFLWLGAAWVYSYYLAHFSRIQVMYAGLANVIIALVFLYFSAALLILGGEINHALMSCKSQNGNQRRREGWVAKP